MTDVPPEEAAVTPSARELLAELYDRDGELTTEAVVEAAAPPTSALHRYFEWDDTEAARRYRLDQAAALIRRVKVSLVVTEGGQPRNVRVRAYVPTDDQRGAYRATADLPPDDLAIVEARFRVDAEAFEQRYSHLQAYREWVAAQAVQQPGKGGRKRKR